LKFATRKTGLLKIVILCYIPRKEDARHSGGRLTIKRTNRWS